jgi:hypothetical protein
LSESLPEVTRANSGRGRVRGPNADPQLLREPLGSDLEIADVLRSSDGSRLVVVKQNWIQKSHEYRPTVWEPVMTHSAPLV